jgi:O-antigen/teichoic acid export membrane protein
VTRLKNLGLTAIIYGLSMTLLRLSGLILISLFTNTLSKEEFGALSTLLITIETLIYLVGMGSREAFMRYYPKMEPQGELPLLLKASTIIHLLSGILTTLIFISGVGLWLLKGMELNNPFVVLVLVCICGMNYGLFLLASSYLRATGKSKQFGIINLVTTLLLMILYYIGLKYSAYKIEWVIASQALVYLVVFIFITAKILLKKSTGSLILHIKEQLTFGAPLVLLSLATWFEWLVIGVLGKLSGQSAVAFMMVGLRFSRMINMILVQPFLLAIEPYIYKHYTEVEFPNEAGKVLLYYTTAYFFIAYGVVVGSSFLIHYTTPPEYHLSMIWVLVLLPIGWLIGAKFVFRMILNSHQKTWYALAVSACSFLLVIPLLNPIITRFQVAGAALLILAFYSLSLVQKFILSQYWYPSNIPILKIIVIMFFHIIFSLYCYTIIHLSPIPFLIYSLPFFVLLVTLIFVTKIIHFKTLAGMISGLRRRRL